MKDNGRIWRRYVRNAAISYHYLIFDVNVKKKMVKVELYHLFEYRINSILYTTKMKGEAL